MSDNMLMRPATAADLAMEVARRRRDAGEAQSIVERYASELAFLDAEVRSRTVAQGPAAETLESCLARREHVRRELLLAHHEYELCRSMLVAAEHAAYSTPPPNVVVRHNGPFYGGGPAVEKRAPAATIDDAPRAAAARAVRVLEWLTPVLPKRIANEELGEAVEDVRTYARSGATPWQVRFRAFTWGVILTMNLVRFIAAAVTGKDVKRLS